MASVFHQVVAEQLLVLVQQQYEVHTDVRVTIDALKYDYNHDARTQSPRLPAARQQTVGGSWLGPRDKEEQRTQRESFVTCRSYNSTHTAAAAVEVGDRVGFGCLVERIPREAPTYDSSRSH